MIPYDPLNTCTHQDGYDLANIEQKLRDLTVCHGRVVRCACLRHALALLHRIIRRLPTLSLKKNSAGQGLIADSCAGRATDDLECDTAA